MSAEREAELQAWRGVLSQATHVRPRQWCGVWQLHAYNRSFRVPYLGSIEDSLDAMDAVREAGISVEDIYA